MELGALPEAKARMQSGQGFGKPLLHDAFGPEFYVVLHPGPQRVPEWRDQYVPILLDLNSQVLGQRLHSFFDCIP